MGIPAPSPRAVTGNTSAVRVADHRSRHVRLDVSIPPRTGMVVDDLASQYGCTRSEVVRSLLRFALTNRDWKTQGLIWRE
jgi:hypothetical protein